MCMWFGFNPAVNFCHFSTLLTLSVFAGATSTSLKFDLFFLFKTNGRKCDFEYPIHVIINSCEIESMYFGRVLSIF